MQKISMLSDEFFSPPEVVATVLSQSNGDAVYFTFATGLTVGCGDMYRGRLAHEKAA